MKYYLRLLMLVFIIGCGSKKSADTQMTKEDSVLADYFSTFHSVGVPFDYTPKKDTTCEIFMVSDISDYGTNKKNPPIFWMIGFTITDYDGLTNKKYHFDKKMKPLSKNIIVWQSKPIDYK